MLNDCTAPPSFFLTSEPMMAARALFKLHAFGQIDGVIT